MKGNAAITQSSEYSLDELRALLPTVERWLACVRILLEKHCIRSRETNANHDNSQTTDAVPGVGSIEPISSAKPVRQEHAPVDALPRDADERQRLRAIFEQYEACQDSLTAPQWTVVCLRFLDCLTEREIARRLGRSRSAVNGLLQRAKKEKDVEQRRLREEIFLIKRKHLNL